MIWEFLRDCDRSHAYINIAIVELYGDLDPRDRPFATELINGSVRMRRYLDHVIDSLVDRSVDDQTRSVLRLSCYEALMMSTAEHAAVNEYVNLAKQVIGHSRAGFVNAVMRRVIRERDQIRSRPIPLGVRASHPDWIVDAFRQVVPEERLELELESHNQPASTQVVSFVELKPELAERSSNLPYSYTLKVPPSEVPEIASGDAFVQDEGSQIVVQMALGTDPECQRRWLDLCAGPGGKFRYLKHFLDPEHLVGNELHPHRAELVRKYATGYQISIGDGRHLENFGVFDRILLDAPCSGIGALRRRPDARWQRTEADLKDLVTLQRELLDSAANLLNHHGIIAYITCSPHPLETRVQAADFLRRHKNFRLRSLRENKLPRHLEEAVTSEGMLQLLTARDGTDSMFLALLERID